MIVLDHSRTTANYKKTLGDLCPDHRYNDDVYCSWSELLYHGNAIITTTATATIPRLTLTIMMVMMA